MLQRLPDILSAGLLAKMVILLREATGHEDDGGCRMHPV
jgi:hypothetical protein